MQNSQPFHVDPKILAAIQSPLRRIQDERVRAIANALRAGREVSVKIGGVEVARYTPADLTKHLYP